MVVDQDVGILETPFVSRHRPGGDHHLIKIDDPEALPLVLPELLLHLRDILPQLTPLPSVQDLGEPDLLLPDPPLLVQPLQPGCRHLLAGEYSHEVGSPLLKTLADLQIQSALVVEEFVMNVLELGLLLRGIVALDQLLSFDDFLSALPHSLILNMLEAHPAAILDAPTNYF